MPADLHLHSIASDGELDPVTLLERAAACGIVRLSITDHDTLAAYRWRDGAVHLAARRLGLELVVGIELDATMEGREVHLLGYALDTEEPLLAEHLSAVRQARCERARRELALVNELLGAHTLREEQIFVEGRDMPMRPHFIRPLVAQGRFGSYGESRAWFRENAPPGRVPKPEVARAIAMIHGAGGWAVLAHPGYYWREGLPILDRLAELRAAGLDGVEAEYPYASSSPEVFPNGAADRFTAELRPLSEALGLRLTRGSDSHFAADFDRVYGPPR
jgi:predicted metal-dependent phosphoesterase TrpH